MKHEDDTYSEPLHGNEEGIITGYLCKISFDHELGNDSQGTKIYPSIKALEERDKCVSNGCGIVEVQFRESDTQVEDWPFHGYMEHVCFNYEAGGAPLGASFYPNEARCREHEPYAKRYGVVSVHVRKVRIVQEEDDELMMANSVKGTELTKWRNDKNYHPLNNSGKPVEGMGGPENWGKFFGHKEGKEDGNVE
tara:strand:+ start:1411 stop:1992 length:582 start_codon:yes stop_codon:yes gene_type:complete